MSWDEKAANVPLQGVVKVINQDLQLPVLNYNNLMREYFREVLKSMESGDYTRPKRFLFISQEFSAREKTPVCCLLKVKSTSKYITTKPRFYCAA